MKRILIIMIFTLSMVVFSGCSSTIDGDKALNNKKWVEDIDYLDKKLKSEHPDLFRCISKEEWNKSIDVLKSGVNELSDISISLRIAQIISSINDAHTSIDKLDLLTPIGNKTFTSKDVLEFPIKCEYFEDELRVIECGYQYKDILGCKLLSINNVEIDKVIRKISTLASYDNQQYAKEKAKEFINTYEFLKFLEIVDTDEVEYLFENDKKEKIALKVKALKNKDINYTSFNRKEFKTNERPQGESDFYWFKHFKEDNILYLKFNKCFSSTSKGLNKEQKKEYPNYYDFEKKLIVEINKGDFNKFVIDLRDNKGGAFDIVEAMRVTLKYKTNLIGKDVVIIIGKRTCSAAVVLAWKLQNQLGGVTIIGEETGGNLNLFGTEGYIITLPNSKLTIKYPSSIVDNKKGHSGGVKPDIEIKQTHESYLNGIDDCYKYIKNSK